MITITKLSPNPNINTQNKNLGHVTLYTILNWILQLHIYCVFHTQIVLYNRQINVNSVIIIINYVDT